MKILNFGSLNMDYVYRVPYLVKPGETLSSLERSVHFGGKGLNQSIAAARAGAKVWHAGKVGTDGKVLRDVLAENHVDVTYVLPSHQATGHAIIEVDTSGQNSIILYGGSNLDISKEDVDAVLSHFDEGDIVLLQNEISNLSYLIENASSRGLRIALNPSPINDSLLAAQLDKVTWLILNEIEGALISKETQTDHMAAALLAKYPDTRVVLTLGKGGVRYLDRDTTEQHGIYDVKVVDTTAAGDTFTGYFMAGVSEGLAVPANLERASKAASIAVSREGASTSIPLLEEVLAFREPLLQKK